MTREERVALRVRQQLREEVLALAKHGPEIADAWVEQVLSEHRTIRRPAPGPLHGKAHALVREIVLDAIEAERFAS